MKHCPQAGVDLLTSFEGCRLTAYQCPRGIWTIGYGHTEGVHEGMVVTQDEAEAMLLGDLDTAESAITERVRVDLTDNQFAALCSFVFNIGAGNFQGSSLLAHLNRGEYLVVPSALKRWNHVNGEVSEGLTRRREAEAALWLAEQQGASMVIVDEEPHGVTP